MTVIEYARMSGVTERTVRRWIASGQVRTVGHGRDRRVVSVMSDSPSKPPDIPDVDGHEQRSSRTTVDGQSDMDTDADIRTDIRDTEAVHLAALVRELSVENRRLYQQVIDITTAATLWQERARVMADQLAIRAPAESPGASHLTPGPTDPTTGAIRGLSWPVARVVAIGAVVAVLLAAGALLMVVR